MFTGIIEEVGRIAAVERGRDSLILTVTAEKVLEDMQLGDSVSIDGVCQTVTKFNTTSFTVDTLSESLKKTTLSKAAAGREVNLERAVTPVTRMGGHFVQGHVNGTGQITEIRKTPDNIFFTVKIPRDMLRYCIPEGSIALDGISLTIARLDDPLLTVNIIPHTFGHTSLKHKKAGDDINIETDLLGRYVERLLNMKPEGLTFEKMKSLGF